MRVKVRKYTCSICESTAVNYTTEYIRKKSVSYMPSANFFQETFAIHNLEIPAIIFDFV